MFDLIGLSGGFQEMSAETVLGGVGGWGHSVLLGF